MKKAHSDLASHYLEQQVQTASREQILILLFEGAIRFLNLAKKAHGEQDVEKYHHNLVRAQRIIVEFMTSLDMRIGGETAQNLYRLYEYLHYTLVQANIKKDVTMVDEVLKHLISLKETWEEAIRIAAREQRSAQSEERALSA